MIDAYPQKAIQVTGTSQPNRAGAAYSTATIDIGFVLVLYLVVAVGLATRDLADAAAAVCRAYAEVTVGTW